MASTHQKIIDLNDDYMNTIYAIVGFMNLYSFELKKDKIEVKLFQGRKFNKQSDPDPKNFVTPDIGILVDKDGIIGEVKYSFPKDETLWINDFNQLKNYDEKLIGWPIDGEKIKKKHDIILLVHQSRSRKVKDYYVANFKSDSKFKNPFIIIEFNRSDQGKHYFNFRIEHGKLSNEKIHSMLYEGVPVPMEKLIQLYSRIKIYDSKPYNVP